MLLRKPTDFSRFQASTTYVVTNKAFFKEDENTWNHSNIFMQPRPNLGSLTESTNRQSTLLEFTCVSIEFQTVNSG